MTSVSKQFWRLDHLPYEQSTFHRADWAPEMDIEQVTCPINDGHMRGGKRTSDLSVVLPCKTVQDFVWVWGGDCLLQDRVLALFQENNITGFEVKPVQAAFKKQDCKKNMPILWELVVTGWAGVASPESGVRLTQECPGCGLLEYEAPLDSSKIIDPHQWDGSDIFMVWPLPKFIFVSDRAKKLVESTDLTGVQFVDPKNLAFRGKYQLGGLSPGRLSRWMPEARARELGEPLGIY